MAARWEEEEEEIYLGSDSRKVCMSSHFLGSALDLLVCQVWKLSKSPVRSL